MFIIILIILIILILMLALNYKNKTYISEQDSLIENKTKLYRTIDNVDEKVKELEKIIETRLNDIPEDNKKLLTEIIQEWAEIQKSHHLDNRSWVRNPKKFYD